jgi:hypothetical protein
MQSAILVIADFIRIPLLKKWFERNAAKVKRRQITKLPSLRRHYPDQVLRVFLSNPANGRKAPRETEILCFQRIAHKDTNIIFFKDIVTY